MQMGKSFSKIPNLAGVTVRIGICLLILAGLLIPVLAFPPKVLAAEKNCVDAIVTRDLDRESDKEVKRYSSFFLYKGKGSTVRIQPERYQLTWYQAWKPAPGYPAGYITLDPDNSFYVWGYLGCDWLDATYPEDAVDFPGKAPAAQTRAQPQKTQAQPQTSKPKVAAQPALPSPTSTPWNCSPFAAKMSNYNDWPKGVIAKVQIWRELPKTGNSKGDPTIDKPFGSVKPSEEYFVEEKNNFAYKLWANDNPNTPFWVAEDAVFCVYPNPYLKATATPVPSPSPTPKPEPPISLGALPPANNISYTLPNTSLVEKGPLNPLLIIVTALGALVLVIVFGYYYILPRSPKTVSSLAKWGLIKPQKAREILEDGLVARAREAIPRLDTLIANINAQIGNVKIKKNKSALNRFLKIATDQRGLAQRIADTISENKMVRGFARQTREIVGEVYKLRFNTKFTIEEGDGKIAAELAGLNAYLTALEDLDRQIN